MYIFEKGSSFGAVQVEKVKSLGAIQAENRDFRAAHTRTALIWEPRRDLECLCFTDVELYI